MSQLQTEMPPLLLIIAGPNGAGKTTTAMHLLPNVLQIKHFVNADLIAKGLSPFDPSMANWNAARIMVERMRQLTDARETFAVETTLASRSFVSMIERCQQAGYNTELLFIALSDAKLAKERVALRVSQGGHDVPDEIVERRFELGLKNFFELYMKQIAKWTFAENTINRLIKIAEASPDNEMIVYDNTRWIWYKEMVKP
ncbi:MAG: zeta toxin family protein [Planctomycetaceae bacterium]|nr:zeta toxin family protein [Planctomycetaceae bacterium]